MPRITNLSFELNGSTYSLLIDLNEYPEDDTITFDVLAKREGGEGIGTNSLSARVEIKPVDRRIVVYVQDQTVLELDGFEELIPAEKLIDELPIEILDPILGCAAKGGISATVGQGIRCFKNLQESGAWKLFHEFLGCMKQNLGRITVVAGARTFRCILRSVVGG